MPWRVSPLCYHRIDEGVLTSLRASLITHRPGHPVLTNGRGIAVRKDVRTDLGNAPRAHVAESPLHFVRKYLDRPRGARLPAACRAVKRGPADQHHLRTEGQRLDDVAAAADAAVEYDGAAVADSVHDLREYVYGRYGAVKGASAVIRHHHAVGARVDGGARLIAAQNALDDELARPEVAEFPDMLPGHRLECLRTRALLAIDDRMAVALGKIGVRGHAFVHEVLAHHTPHPAGMHRHVHRCRDVGPEGKGVAVALVVLAPPARRGVDGNHQSFPAQVACTRDHFV